MGNIYNPSPTSLLLSTVDRLTAKNAGAGLPTSASHIIALGESAADAIGVGVANLIALGTNAGRATAAAVTNAIAIGEGAAQNGQLSNIIVLGRAALDSGTVDAAAFNGSIVIGDGAASSLVNNGTSGVIDVPLLVMGRNAAPLMQYASSSIIVGDNALPIFVGQTGTPLQSSVIIGHRIGQHIQNNALGYQFKESVVLGYEACDTTANGHCQMSSSVVIGHQAAGALLPAGFASMGSNVVIGYRAAMGADTNGIVGQNVMIGANCCNVGTNVQDSVIIGNASRIHNTGAFKFSNVLIGHNAQLTQLDRFTGLGADQSGGSCNDSVFLGQRISSPAAASPGLVLIGRSAGRNDGGVTMRNTGHQLLIETFVGGVKRTAIFGELSNGNIVLGNSTEGTDRDCPGTNIMKLLNGTTTGAPTGGGYFYVAAGALHWVGSAGTDTVIAPA